MLGAVVGRWRGWQGHKNVHGFFFAGVAGLMLFICAEARRCSAEATAGCARRVGKEYGVRGRGRK